MRSIKLVCHTLLLTIVFAYGIFVGKYKWFPFDQLKVFKKTVKNFRKSNNDNLLFELAKTNNIQINYGLEGLKSISSSQDSDSLKVISFGDSEFKDMKGFLNSVNLQSSSLIIHVGDVLIHGGSQCTDSRINHQLNLMNNLNTSVLYTPGDNEWRDCRDKEKGDMHNLERLAYIRKTYFAQDKTLGKNPSIVENQRIRGYPENARLMIKKIAFITAHNIGSNNNFDFYSKENISEYLKRDAANIDWIKESFERYKDAEAYVVVTHADIFSNKKTPIFYEKFATTLLELSNKYKRQVLLLNGNKEQFSSFKPRSRQFPYLHVITNFGDANVKAILIEINPSKKIPFNVIKLID
tara:strand:- start:8840 stop:9895 length:1056 start_codon:yes stop_codon:yes gene_type:complete